MSTTPKLIVPWFIYWILFSIYNSIWYLVSTTLSILEILFRQKCIFILKTSFFTHNNLLAKKEPWRKRVAPTFRIPSSKAMPLQFSCIEKLNYVCDLKFMFSALNWNLNIKDYLASMTVHVKSHCNVFLFTSF